jgi:hypothetical protein
MMDPGFSICGSVLTSAECASILEAVSDSRAPRQRAGARKLMSHPAIASLAFDDRLLRLASEELGASAVPFRATLFDKSASSNWQVLWHQDRALPLDVRVSAPDWGPWSQKAGVLHALAPAWALERVVALRIHLDASTIDNGPLRVVGHSHRFGVLGDSDVRRLTKGGPISTCAVDQGGVLAMRPLLLHSSTKARCDAPRRVIHLEYADSLDLGWGIRLRVA